MSREAGDSDADVVLGYVSGVHGVHGRVKVFSYTEPREAIFAYQPWRVGDSAEPMEIIEGRRHGKTLLAVLPGVENPEQARRLVGSEIRVRREQLPDPGEQSYYWADLLGLEVRTTGGEALGRIERMMETGANDVMVVSGDRERLVPFVPGRYVRRVDLEEGFLEVDWDPDF
jgi:16S rRNA processing protein RimM